MHDIRTWLKGTRDYVQGVKILLTYTTDDILRRLFTTEGKTPYKTQLLEKALKSILSTSASQQSPSAESPSKMTFRTWEEQADQGPLLSSLRLQWLKAFKEMQDLRSQLLLVESKDERCEMAFRILRLDAECRELLYKRDFFRIHGKLPEEKPHDFVSDPLHMAVRIESLKRYIRREGEKVLKDPSNADAVARRSKFIDELNHYLKLLSKPLYVDQLSEGG
jgi:hypothetical protein